MAPKEEVPLKGFSLEKRLSWKAVNPPLQPSQSERSDVSVSSGTSEKGTSDGIGGHHRGGASIRHRAAESGLSGVPSLKSGYDLTSPVSVRTRVRVWEEIAREGPPVRGFVVGDGSEQKAEKKGLVLTQKANQEEVFVDVAGKTEGYQTTKDLNEIDELPDMSEWDISEWGESDMESERGGKPEVGVSKSFGLTRLGASESADEMEKLRAAETEPRGVKKPDGVETNGNGTEKLEAGDLFGREVSETEAVVRASDRDQNGVQKLEAGQFPVRGCWGRWAVYLSNRRAQTAMLVLWLAANLGVFAYKYLYSMDNPEYHIVG